MQVATNTELVERGQRVGRITSLAGLVVLILGLIVSFTQRTNLQQFSVIIVYASLLIGFVLSNIGIYMANKWVREPRADQLLEKVLKGFDKRYNLYNWALPAEHVLVTPSGVITFVIKPQTGTISCDGDHWRHKLTLGRLVRFLTSEGLGNPSKEAKAEAGNIARILQEKMPEEEIPVIPMVVFTADPEKLNLNIQNPTVLVVHISSLKEQVREIGKERYLSSSVHRQLVETLDEAGGVVA